MLKYLILFSIIVTNAVQAQNVKSPPGSFSGMVIYSAHVQMRETPTLDTLRFNRQKSFFQWQRKMFKRTITVTNNNIPQKSVKLIPPPDRIGNYVIYNVAKDSLYSRKRTREMANIGNQGIFVKAQAPDINWNIRDSTKQIGNYKAIKATAHFRGRDYTAWFTPEIPMPYGPWKLIGLPGLILQAHDSLNNIRFDAKKVVFKNLEAIGAPSLTDNEDVINFAQYKEWMIRHKKMWRRKMKKKILKRQQVLAQKHGHTIKSVRVHIPLPKSMEIFGKKDDKN